MTTQSLMIPDVEPLAHDHAALLDESRRILAIPDVPTYERAAICKRGLVARRIFIEDFFKPIKQAIDGTKRVVLDRQRLVETPVKEQEDRIGGLMVGWTDEQERRRRLAEKNIQEEAALAEAEHHQAMGDQTSAEEALNGRGLVNPTVQSTVPKVAGISYRETHSAEVMDFAALVKAVADGKAPMAYLLPNQIALNAAARSLKEELNSLPGLRCVVTKTAVGRR